MCSLPVLATVCFAACVTFCLRMPYVHMYISLLSEPPEFKKRAFPLVDMGVPPWTQGRGHARGVHAGGGPQHHHSEPWDLNLWLCLSPQLSTPALIEPLRLSSVSNT